MEREIRTFKQLEEKETDEEYLVKKLPKARVKQIVKDIANNSHKPINYFTETYLLESNRLTKLIIERAIVEVIVDDETVSLLEKRVKKKKSIERFKMLKEERRKVQCQYTTNCKCYFDHKCNRCEMKRDYNLHQLMREIEEHVKKGDLLDYQG